MLLPALHGRPRINPPLVAGLGDRSEQQRHPRRTKGTCRSITRGSSFAGRVTEAAALRKERVVAERGELRPAVTRMTCSDVHASSARRQWVSGRTASRGSPRSRSLCSNVTILDSLAPDRRTPSAISKETVSTCVARSREPATDRRVGCTSAADEGATLVSLSRETAYESGSQHMLPLPVPLVPWTALRGHESSRVRPDHVLCCIAPAREIVRKGEGIPGRGNSVSFTRCEANRPRRDQSSVRRPYGQRDAASLATGCQRWLESLTRREDNALRAQRHQHRSAQRRRETPSAPASLRKLERTR